LDQYNLPFPSSYTRGTKKKEDLFSLLCRKIY